jgi:hypothetical protein
MITINYYIEDLVTGFVVMDDDTMEQFSLGTPKAFGLYELALDHIENLPASQYRIFSRIVKS